MGALRSVEQALFKFRHVATLFFVHVNVQLMMVWNVCPQTLQDSSPVLVFLSILTETEFSWLQNRHWKVVARASRCCTISRVLARLKDEHNLRTFFLASGLLADLRLPCSI